MNCASSGNPVPEAAAFCPKCGKPQPAAGPSKTATPSAKAPPAADGSSAPIRDAEGFRWLVENQAAFNAWRKKLKFVGIPCGIAAFLIVFLMLAKSMPTWGFAVAVVVGVAVDTVVEAFILPNYTFPTIACPYCGQQVKIAELPKAFGRWQRTRACPYCKREFPH